MTLAGDDLGSFQVDSAAQVLSLKERLERITGLHPLAQQLVWNGQVLEDDHRFDQSCDVTHDLCIVQLVVREFVPVVFDSGSWLFRGGLANREKPSAVFKNVVGRVRNPGIVGLDIKPFYVGEEAERNRGVLMMRYPMDRGIITNWEDMERVWHHAFYNEIQAAPEQHPILLTEPSLNPKANREKAVHLMFETFDVPLLCLARRSELVLRSTGLATGLVVKIGDGCSHIVPIYEGHSILHAISEFEVGGRTMTDCLRKLSAERGYSFSTSAELDVLRAAKEELAYVALDFQAECIAASNIDRTYEHTPNSHPLTFGNERFRCAEVLFTGIWGDMDSHGIRECIVRSLNNCDPDLRRPMLANVLLVGATAMLPGLPERMARELAQSVKDSYGIAKDSVVRVAVANGGANAIWLAGSSMCDSSGLRGSWLSRKQYDKFGPKIVHWFCL